MNANEFDRVIRDRLSGVTEAAPDVWEGISSGLARRHRRVVMRRFATGAVAAAAGLALALLVFRDRVPEGLGTAPVRIARAVAAPSFTFPGVTRGTSPAKRCRISATSVVSATVVIISLSST